MSKKIFYISEISFHKVLMLVGEFGCLRWVPGNLFGPDVSIFSGGRDRDSEDFKYRKVGLLYGESGIDPIYVAIDLIGAIYTVVLLGKFIFMK